MVHINTDHRETHMKKLISIFAFFFAFACADAQLYSITDSCSVLVIKNVTSGRSTTYPKSQLYADTSTGVLNLRQINGTIIASWSASQVSSLPASSIYNGYQIINHYLSYTCVHATGMGGGGGGNVGSDTLRTLTGTYLPDFVLVEGVDSFSLYSANYIITDTLVTVSGFFSCRVLPNKRRGGFLLSLPTSGENIPYTKLHGNVTGYTVGFDNIPIDVGIVIIDTTFYPDSAAYFLFTGDTARKSLYAYTYTYVSNKRAIGQIVSYAAANIYNSDGFVNASQRRVNIDMKNNVIGIIDTSTVVNPFNIPHGLIMGYANKPLDYISYGANIYIASDSSQINMTTGTFQKQSLNYAYTEPIDPIIDSSVMVVVGGSIGSWYKLNDIRGWGLNGNAGTDPATNFLGTTDSVGFNIRSNNVQMLHFDEGTTYPNIVIGASTEPSSGENDIVIGNNVSMIGIGSQNFSIAIGSGSSVGGRKSVAIGGGSQTVGAGSDGTVAIGYRAIATGESSTAIGYNAYNTTLNQFAIGAAQNTIFAPAMANTVGSVLTDDGTGIFTSQPPVSAGATGSEPSTPYLGQFYFDTTLTKMKFWNGTVWAVITSTP